MGIKWIDCTYNQSKEIHYRRVLNYTGEDGNSSPVDKEPSYYLNDITNGVLKLQMRQYGSSYSSEKYVDIYTFAIKFTTPASKVNFDSLVFTVTMTTVQSKRTLRYAIKTSDLNLKYYNYGTKTYSDQVAEGSIDTSSWTEYGAADIKIDSLDLSPNTTYYLVIYYDSYSVSTESLMNLGYVTIKVSPKGGIVYINSEEYTCNIDLGSDYWLYQPHIDNGTSWDPL